MRRTHTGTLLLLVSGLALAGVTVTQVVPVTYELRDPDSHPIPGAKGFKTLDECIAAAPVPAIKYRCIQLPVVFDKVGNCDDVPAPAPVVDAEGFTDAGVLEGHACPESLAYYFTQTQLVRDNALYPKCWEVRPVQITDCTALIEDWWKP